MPSSSEPVTDRGLTDVGLGVVFQPQSPSGPSRVLITRRRHDTVLPGLWEIPGGKREPGETIEACIAREIREEVGLEVEVGGQLGVWEHHYPHAHVRLHAHRCRVLVGEPAAIHVAEFAWVGADELLCQEYPEASLPLIRVIADTLRQ
jgi:mutator protein MutT